MASKWTTEHADETVDLHGEEIVLVRVRLARSGYPIGTILLSMGQWDVWSRERPIRADRLLDDDEMSAWGVEGSDLIYLTLE